MPFEPGHSGNKGGRPAGSSNNATAELRAFIQNFINSNIDKIQVDFDDLEPKERLAFIEKLLKYVLPRQTEPIGSTIDLAQITGHYLRRYPEDEGTA